MVVLAAVAFVFTIRYVTKHPYYAKMRFRDIVVAGRRPLLIGVVAILGATAVASEADKPSGLTFVKVTPTSGEPFDAITVGQKQGRATFLRLTSDLRIVRHGVVEFTPGALRMVDLNGPIIGPEDKRPFWKRVSDWASTRVPVMRR